MSAGFTPRDHSRHAELPPACDLQRWYLPAAFRIRSSLASATSRLEKTPPPTSQTLPYWATRRHRLTQSAGETPWSFYKESAGRSRPYAQRLEPVFDPEGL